MTRWTGAPAVAWVVVVSVCACSSDDIPVGAREARCRSFCEQSKSCPAADPRTVDCFKSCDDLDALNHANDCNSEFDAYYDCVERHGVCSDLETLCTEFQDVYSDCLSESCSSDPDRDVCL